MRVWKPLGLFAVLACAALAGCVAEDGTRGVEPALEVLTNPAGVPYGDLGLAAIAADYGVHGEPFAPVVREGDDVLACPVDAEDPWGDRDSDGLLNQYEAWWGTDPNVAFSLGRDVQGVPDGVAVHYAQAWPVILDGSSNLDNDHDGLPAAAERCFLGLDPNLPSTDGDVLDDGVEYFGRPAKHRTDGYYVAWTNLKPAMPVDAFEPAYALLAVATRDVMLIVEPKVVEGESSSDVRAIAAEFSTVHADVQKQFVSAKVTVQAQAAVSTNPTKAGVTASVTAEASAGLSAESSVATHDTNKRSAVQRTVRTQTSTLDWDDAKVTGKIVIENQGNAELANAPVSISVIVEYLDPAGWQLLCIPAENLKNDVTGLDPGASMLHEFSCPSIGYRRSTDILAGMPLRARVQNFDYGAAQDATESVAGRNVHLEVDLGGADGVRINRYVPIARDLHVAGGDASTLADVLAAAGLPVVTLAGDFVGLEVDGERLVARESNGSAWLVRILRHGEGGGYEDVPLQGLDFAQVMLQRGDRVSMLFARDSDNDRLSDREELAIGTDILQPDTDQDGLDDYVEWVSGQDPTLHNRRAGLIIRPSSGDCQYFTTTSEGWVTTETFDRDHRRCNVAPRGVGTFVEGSLGDQIVIRKERGDADPYTIVDPIKGRWLVGILGGATGPAFVLPPTTGDLHRILVISPSNHDKYKDTGAGGRDSDTCTLYEGSVPGKQHLLVADKSWRNGECPLSDNASGQRHDDVLGGTQHYYRVHAETRDLTPVPGTSLVYVDYDRVPEQRTCRRSGDQNDQCTTWQHNSREAIEQWCRLVRLDTDATVSAHEGRCLKSSRPSLNVGVHPAANGVIATAVVGSRDCPVVTYRGGEAKHGHASVPCDVEAVRGLFAADVLGSRYDQELLVVEGRNLRIFSLEDPPILLDVVPIPAGEVVAVGVFA